MCTALAAMKKVRDKTGLAPLGIATAAQTNPLGLIAGEEDPLSINPLSTISNNT